MWTLTFHLVLQRDQESVSNLRGWSESNTLLTCLSLVTGSQSPHDVSSAMCVVGQPLTTVPPDDSMECLGQFESRGSPSGSEEQRISKFGLTECVYV